MDMHVRLARLIHAFFCFEGFTSRKGATATSSDAASKASFLYLLLRLSQGLPLNSTNELPLFCSTRAPPCLPRHQPAATDGRILVASFFFFPSGRPSVSRSFLFVILFVFSFVFVLFCFFARQEGEAPGRRGRRRGRGDGGAELQATKDGRRRRSGWRSGWRPGRPGGAEMKRQENGVVKFEKEGRPPCVRRPLELWRRRAGPAYETSGGYLCVCALFVSICRARHLTDASVVAGIKRDAFFCHDDPRRDPLRTQTLVETET